MITKPLQHVALSFARRATRTERPLRSSSAPRLSDARSSAIARAASGVAPSTEHEAERTNHHRESGGRFPSNAAEADASGRSAVPGAVACDPPSAQARPIL